MLECLDECQLGSATLHTHSCVVSIHSSVLLLYIHISGTWWLKLVEHRPQDPMDSRTRGSNPVRSTNKIYESFSESKCCAGSLLVCPTPVCIHTHKHVCTLRILWSMSEFGGLQKHENTAHRKKLKSAILWLLAFPRESSPNFLCTALG